MFINRFLHSHKRSLVWAIAVVLTVFGTLIPSVAQAAAEQLTSRKVTLGGTSASAVSQTGVTNKFDFTQPGSDTLGSIKFLYCTTASGSCTAPTGLSLSSATLDAQSGQTGFSMGTRTANSAIITRTASAGGGTLSYTLGTITNPDTNGTYYVRITTYTGTDGATGPDDTGTVAFAIVNQITLTGTVDESLTFCVAITVAINCSTATGTAVSFSPDNIFDTSSVTFGTSQMSAATNGTGGYIITVAGNTLTSGSNTIDAMTSATTSSPGTEQFGLNLKDNATPNVGTDEEQNSGNSNGAAQTGYGTADNYKFVTGNTVAASTGASDFTRYTISYIVNISGFTEAGSYTTTLTYVCTATF